MGNGAEPPATRGLKRPRAVEEDGGGGVGRPGARGVGGGGRPMTPYGSTSEGANGGGVGALLGA